MYCGGFSFSIAVFQFAFVIAFGGAIPAITNEKRNMANEKWNLKNDGAIT
jgi:hypothetical protein